MSLVNPTRVHRRVDLAPDCRLFARPTSPPAFGGIRSMRIIHQPGMFSRARQRPGMSRKKSQAPALQGRAGSRTAANFSQGLNMRDGRRREFTTGRCIHIVDSSSEGREAGSGADTRRCGSDKKLIHVFVCPGRMVGREPAGSRGDEARFAVLAHDAFGKEW